MKAYLILVLLCMSTAQRIVGLDDIDAVTGQAGETLALRISSNPTTGYSWFFVPSNSKTATLLNGYTGNFIPSDSGLVGAPGQQEFQVQIWEQANPNDTYQFTLIKKRPWEDTTARTKTVTITVVQ